MGVDKCFQCGERDPAKLTVRHVMRSGKRVVFCSKRCKQRIENEEAKDALARMDLRGEFGNALLRADLDFVHDCAFRLSPTASPETFARTEFLLRKPLIPVDVP